MLLVLRNDHKQHLSFLTNQSNQVLIDFCKLALDFLQNGPNFKRYNKAAKKLETSTEIVKLAVEALVNLLIEGYKNKLNEKDFSDSATALGFNEEKQQVLAQLFEARHTSISGSLSSLGPNLPFYRDLQWRFEAQIASRYLNRQTVPIITIQLQLQQSPHANFSDFNNINAKESTIIQKLEELTLSDASYSSSILQEIFLQTDPNNLIRLVSVLERALQEGKSQRVRGIAKALE